MICFQVRSKDSQVKTQLVLWILILFKVTKSLVTLNKIIIHNTSCVLICESLLHICILEHNGDESSKDYFFFIIFFLGVLVGGVFHSMWFVLL
jgi:hypothetical protein